MTKEILTAKGDVILVDADMYPMLSSRKWHLSGRFPYKYPKTSNGKRDISMSHLVSGYTPWHKVKGLVVDHINRNVLDNRRENLRFATHTQNNANKLVGQKQKWSRFKGVSGYSDWRKWKSYINVNDRQIVLGYYDTELEAAEAYNKAAVEYFGEYAMLNDFALREPAGEETNKQLT